MKINYVAGILRTVILAICLSCTFSCKLKNSSQVKSAQNTGRPTCITLGCKRTLDEVRRGETAGLDTVLLKRGGALEPTETETAADRLSDEHEKKTWQAVADYALRDVNISA